MSRKPIDIERVKKIIRQIAGRAKPEDGDLIVPSLIKGSGYIWCYNPQSKDLKRIARGTKIYIVDDAADKDDRVLVYTDTGEIVFIERDELLMIGLN